MTEMKPPAPQESAFHSQSVPLVQAKPAHQALFPYFLVVLGTLLVVALAGYLWINSGMRAEMESKRLDIEREKMVKEIDNRVEKIRRELEFEAQQAALAQQRDAQAQLAKLAESTLGTVEDFETAREQWSEVLAAQGREIAARDELLTKYEAILQQHPVPEFDPEAVRERVATVAARSRSLATGDGVTVAPSPEVKQSVDTDMADAKAALRSQEAKNQALQALVSEALADQAPAAEVGIEEALALRLERREQALLQAVAEAEARGRKQAEERIQKAADESAQKIADMDVEAASDLFDQQQEKIKQLHDRRRLAEEAKNEEEVRILTAQLDKEIALLREQAALAEGEVRVVEAAAAAKQSEKELEAERIKQETEKNRLREKAKSREVATALAPFIGKGYWQPGRAQPDRDAAGISLSAIKAQGGLDPSPRGMRELYHIGANPNNDRPGGWSKEDRMVGKPLEAWLKNKPGARDTARKAQDLLLELGDILVEVGLLSP